MVNTRGKNANVRVHNASFAEGLLPRPRPVSHPVNLFPLLLEQRIRTPFLCYHLLAWMPYVSFVMQNIGMRNEWKVP